MNAEFRVNSLSNSHIDQIAILHQKAFPDVLIGQLGKRFTRYFYEKILYHENGIIIIYTENEKIQGFVAGVTEDNGFYDIKFYLNVMLGFVFNVFNPSIVLNLLRNIKKMITLRNDHYSSELLSLAVSSSCQGKGIGTKLVGLFDKHLKSRRVNVYQVFTDMNYSIGYKLYDKLNFILYKEMNLFGLTLRMYLRRL